MNKPRIVLFYVWALMILLVNCSFTFQYSFVFCAPVKAKASEQKRYATKKVAEFHNQFALLALRGGRL